MANNERPIYVWNPSRYGSTFHLVIQQEAPHWDAGYYWRRGCEQRPLFLSDREVRTTVPPEAIKPCKRCFGKDAILEWPNVISKAAS